MSAFPNKPHANNVSLNGRILALVADEGECVSSIPDPGHSVHRRRRRRKNE